MSPFRHIRVAWLIGGLLGALTLGAYWPVLHHGFSAYDDLDYVTENAHVQAGLSWEGMGWAFRSTEAANWHPLTWLSHMLDVQLFGPHARGHHFTNLLLHLANSLLVLVLAQRWTHRLWRSALVAALFALHPLHVESVAWVAERKDVLSGCFFLLTLYAYTRYAQSALPGAGLGSREAPGTRQSAHGKEWYLLSLMLFCLGLLSKPMVVTLPCVLLLLDYWPLQRLDSKGQPARRRTLLLEKAPFLALSTVSCGMTLLAQGRGGTVSSLQDYPLVSRLADAAAAYLQYLGKMVWPLHLAVFYPHPASGAAERWAGWQLGLAGLVLVAITALAWRRRKTEGWLLTGWLWFLGMLVPVIGLVQVGTQAMADRYTYLPLLGMFLCVVWGGATWGETWLAVRTSATVRPDPAASTRTRSLAGRWRQGLLAMVGAGLILGCVGLTRRQVNYWRDDFTLFEHALALNERNATAHAGLGLAWGHREKYGFALAHCRAAVQADSSCAPAWHTLGDIHTLLGKLSEAEQDYHTALKWKPNSAWSWFKLGYLNALRNNPQEAEQDYRTALRWKPDLVAAHNNLAALLLSCNRREEALGEFARCVQLSPQEAKMHYNLGTTLADLGRLPQAEAELRLALRLKPNDLEARAALAGVLAQSGRSTQSAALVETLARECARTGQAHLQLGNALWNAGLTNEAAAAFAHATRLEPALPQILLRVAQSLVAQGRLADAARQYRVLLAVAPHQADAHQRLGLLLANQGQLAEAVSQLREALRLARTVENHYHLALVLSRAGNGAEAIEHYSFVLHAQPDFAPALNDLAWLRATAPQAELRNGAEAVGLAERACQLAGGRNVGFLGTLAAAYAEANRFEDAVATAEKARDLAAAMGDKALMASTQARLELYRRHQPCRQ